MVLNIVYLSSAAVLALSVTLLFGALVEMYKQLQQIRRHLELTDDAQILDQPKAIHQPPSRFGLPLALDASASAGVLVLSERCATCHLLAGWLAERKTLTALHVLVIPHGADEGRAFIEEYALRSHPLVDPGHANAVADALEINTTPVIIFIANGLIESLETVPSIRQLSNDIERISRGPSAAEIMTSDGHLARK